MDKTENTINLTQLPVHGLMKKNQVCTSYLKYKQDLGQKNYLILKIIDSPSTTQYNIYTNLYTTQLTQYGQNVIQELRSRNKWKRQNYNSNSKLVDILNENNWLSGYFCEISNLAHFLVINIQCCSTKIVYKSFCLFQFKRGPLFWSYMYMGYQTTRPADNSDGDKSARKWGQIGP
jgi:hypothetical protein